MTVLTSADRLERTRELLGQLTEAKAANPQHENENASEYRQRMVHTKEIGGIVKEILEVNDRWIDKCITQMNKSSQTTEELKSKVVTGGSAHSSKVGGVMRAILNFNPNRGMGGFLTYLETAIRRELLFTQREKRQYKEFGGKVQSLNRKEGEAEGYSAAWVDRTQARPSQRMESKEIADAVKDAIRFLPEERKLIAELMVKRQLEDGKWPTNTEVAEMLGVTKQRGTQIKNLILDKLRERIEKRHPEMAESEELRDAFGAKAKVGR